MTERTDQLIGLLSKLYKKYRTVDPFYIVEQLGLELRYVEFLSKPAGLYSKVMDDPIIFLSSQIENTNQRYFVLAHELHHALEHEDIFSYYTQNSKNRSKIEHEADLFAAIVCLNLYIEEHGVDSMTKQDLENHYGLPIELSELFF